MKLLRGKILGVALYRWIIIGLVGLGLFFTSLIIRDQLNIEWSVESLRNFVRSLGDWGPPAYIAILVFRFLILVPSSILLIASGIIFGPVYGALYAGIGLFGSALIKYAVTMLVGRDTVLNQLPERLRLWVSNIAGQKMSVFALGGICAYPFLPKHIFQFASILSGMGLAAYVSAVFTGSFIRAAIFANIGGAIYSGAGLITATLILTASLILPMATPAWRRWMLAPFTSHSSQKKEPAL